MCIKWTQEDGLKFNLNPQQLIGLSSALIAAGVIYTQASKATACVQSKIVAPIVTQEFKKLHAPYDEALNNVSYNLKIVVEMIKIANQDNPELLNKAIDRVNNTGTLSNQGR